MKIVKLLVVVAIVFVGWKYGLPWVKQHTSHASTASAGDSACVSAAEHANDTFGNGIGRFANPPYDIAAWESFRSDVTKNIDAADAACRESNESCAKARDAMRDLRSLASDLDTAIRSGAPPSSDIVQRQGAVDAQLD